MGFPVRVRARVRLRARFVESTLVRVQAASERHAVSQRAYSIVPSKTPVVRPNIRCTAPSAPSAMAPRDAVESTVRLRQLPADVQEAVHVAYVSVLIRHDVSVVAEKRACSRLSEPIARAVHEFRWQHVGGGAIAPRCQLVESPQAVAHVAYHRFPLRKYSACSRPSPASASAVAGEFAESSVARCQFAAFVQTAGHAA